MVIPSFLARLVATSVISEIHFTSEQLAFMTTRNKSLTQTTEQLKNKKKWLVAVVIISVS